MSHQPDLEESWYSPSFIIQRWRTQGPLIFLKQMSTALPPAHTMCWTWGMPRPCSPWGCHRQAWWRGRSGQWWAQVDMIPGQGLELMLYVDFFSLKNRLPSIVLKSSKAFILTLFLKTSICSPSWWKTKHKCSWLLLHVYKSARVWGQSREA